MSFVPPQIIALCIMFIFHSHRWRKYKERKKPCTNQIDKDVDENGEDGDDGDNGDGDDGKDCDVVVR